MISRLDRGNSGIPPNDLAFDFRPVPERRGDVEPSIP